MCESIKHTCFLSRGKNRLNASAIWPSVSVGEIWFPFDKKSGRLLGRRGMHGLEGPDILPPFSCQGISKIFSAERTEMSRSIQETNLGSMTIFVWVLASIVLLCHACPGGNCLPVPHFYTVESCVPSILLFDLCNLKEDLLLITI